MNERLVSEREMEEALVSCKRSEERYQRSFKVVERTAYLPRNLKKALVAWHEHLFDPDHYKRTGYFQYLPEGHYLHKVWRAASISEAVVEAAEKDGRDLTGIENVRITKAFLQVGEVASNPSLDDEQKAQFEEIAQGVHYLAQLYRDFRGVNRRALNS